MQKFLFYYFFVTALSVQAAETIQSDHVKITWLAPQSFSASSQTTIAIDYKLNLNRHVPKNQINKRVLFLI